MIRTAMSVDNNLRPVAPSPRPARRRSRKDRRGTAAVEFALVAPILFLFVFGIIEFGRLVMVQQILTNASREGARLAVLDDVTASDVTAAVDTYLTGTKVAGASTVVSPNPLSSAGYGDAVTVTVTVPFNQVSWLPTPMFLNGSSLSAATIMRRETVD